MKDYSKDDTMMRCPGCNVGLDAGIGFNNCAGCGGKRYIKKPGFPDDEKLLFDKKTLFRMVDLYTLKIIAMAFAVGFLTATLIFR